MLKEIATSALAHNENYWQSIPMFTFIVVMLTIGYIADKKVNKKAIKR